jgi:hypothetical protein
MTRIKQIVTDFLISNYQKCNHSICSNFYPCRIRLICVIRGLISVAQSEAIQSLLFADSQIYSKIPIYKRLQIITTESKQLVTE